MKPGHETKPPQDEDGNDVAHWWFFHAPDTSDIRALEARIDKAIADARERERAFWRGVKRVPPE